MFLIFIWHVLVQDHIERGNIDLSQLKFRVLDEADEMLRMGFVEDVELILGISFSPMNGPPVLLSVNYCVKYVKIVFVRLILFTRPINY